MTTPKETPPKPSAPKKKPYNQWPFVLVVAALVFMVVFGISILWEKEVEPLVGFDLPNATRDLDPIAVMKAQSPLAPAITPAIPAPNGSPVLPTVETIMEAVQRELAAVMAASPLTQQQQVLDSLRLVALLQGALDGRISMSALIPFMHQRGVGALPASWHHIERLESVTSLIQRLEGPSTMNTSSHETSFWTSFKAWAMGLVKVEKNDAMTVAQKDALKSLLVQGAWTEALAFIETCPPSWAQSHEALLWQIQARLDTEQMLADHYQQLLEARL